MQDLIRGKELAFLGNDNECCELSATRKKLSMSGRRLFIIKLILLFVIPHTVLLLFLSLVLKRDIAVYLLISAVTGLAYFFCRYLLTKIKATTNSKHDLPVALNLLEQDFVISEPGQVWAADITYVATSEGWQYLAGILDLCSREEARIVRTLALH